MDATTSSCGDISIKSLQINLSWRSKGPRVRASEAVVAQLGQAASFECVCVCVFLNVLSLAFEFRGITGSGGFEQTSSRCWQLRLIFGSIW